MKKLLLIPILLVAGCLPASRQEVLELTNFVKEIIPVVREVGGADNEKIDRLLTDIEKVNEAVATAPDPVAAIETGWKASEAWNPYYGYGVLGLTLLRLFQKKKESDNALEEVVIGVEDSKKNGGNLKAAFNATESLVTRRKVKKILNNT